MNDPTGVAASSEAPTAPDFAKFRIARIQQESAIIRSFYLEPLDGGPVVPHQPGQYLPIRLQLAGQADPVTRTYTISDAPQPGRYRLSIKKEGVASSHMHGLKEGDVIEALAPRGEFVLDSSSTRPVVLLSAGVGVTPMIAMLNTLLTAGSPQRAIYFLHAARNGQVLAFSEHLKVKQKNHSNLIVHIRLSQKTNKDKLGKTHHSEGAIDKALLQKLLPLDDYDFYLCGPPPFMQSLYDTLLDMGVSDRRIQFEAFGPASVKRRSLPVPPAQPEAAPPAEPTIAVVFAKSGKSADWRPSAGSLLELAEASGLQPAHSCRSGVCGTCAVRVLAGAVDYIDAPLAAPSAPGEVLICCSRPHVGGVTLDL